MTALFDAHPHIIDPRFELVADDGFVPEPFTVRDYRARTAHLGVARGAVVAGSFQAFDQGWLRAALEELGPGFVGVAQLPADAPDAEILLLHQTGVRAVRFDVYRRGREALNGLEALARRVWDLAGWHAELYVHARDLPELEPRLARLPKVAIDHLGTSADGQDALLRLVGRGARVKATGFGRVDLDVPAALRAIHAVDPTALMAGTDLPSTRARRPFADADLDLIAATLGAGAAAAVLHDNARALYGAR
ncbi:MAG TPA: amidohydrolase family protein [Solirubrobacteraceae bacterium]|nr:amidohydrolase family protein [Solirubrobacteraceae bacterium]